MLDQAGKPVKVVVNPDLKVKVYKHQGEATMVRIVCKKKKLDVPLADWIQMMALKDCIALASDFTRGIVGVSTEDLPTYHEQDFTTS